MSKKWQFVLTVLCGLLVPVLALADQAGDTVTVEAVIDGDTFSLVGGERVRIIGIDAPEDDPHSTRFLSSLIQGKRVVLEYEGDKRDKYGRLLAYAKLSTGEDVGAEMVRKGHALVYVKYPCSRTESYLSLEKEARAAGIGVWSAHFRSTRTAPEQPKPSVDKSTKDITVYVTNTGKKYHRGNCRYLSKSKIPMKLADAASRYGPCKVCSPPVSSSTSSLKAPPKTSDPEPGRCAATTKKGTRCKRKAQAGSIYCWQHKK